jgi:hypothetical protein
MLGAFLLIPTKWILVGKLTPQKLQQTNPWWLFRFHLHETLMQHPALGMSAYYWSSTVVFVQWLRGLGMKVGHQAWLGEFLDVPVPDLVVIGDYVSIMR